MHHQQTNARSYPMRPLPVVEQPTIKARPSHVSRDPARTARATRVLLLVVGVTLGVSATAASVQRRVERWLAPPPPIVPGVAIDPIFYDRTPIAVTITAAWQKVHLTKPADALRSDVTLWRQMHFDDWDKIPPDLREDALHAMWDRYGGLIGNPRQWDGMDANDWDLIPQPIRAMAYIGMIRYWSGYYHVGGLFGLPRGTITNTMSAIVMAESWFEHRGSYTNATGDRDIGLGGSSDYCRRTLDRLYRERVIDFTLTEEDYFDPWQATRVVAVWFQLMLEETSGDLDAAVRAYHRGSTAARLGEGEEYLANVKDKRRRFMRNEGSTPAWEFLFVRAAGQERGRPVTLFPVDNDNRDEG